jgi:hypothetical protein
MTISKISLPRRTFLRGAGVALALPFLDAMVPALSAQSKSLAKPTPRLGFFYVPNGTYLPAWTPAGSGPALEFTPILAPLEPFREHLLVFDGLANHQASLGTGTALHAKAQTAFLSGTFLKETMGSDFRAGKTLDQYAADVLGKDTPLRSLELGTEPGFLASVCESGISCVYQNTMAWRTPTTPLPVENNPRVIFERLFGDGGSAAERIAEARMDRSILDWVTQDVASLERQLGPSDRTRIDEYLSAVREVEQRIPRQERHDAESPTAAAADPPVGIPESVDDHVKLLFDLLLLAYQGDITRVATFMIHREESQVTYPQIGVPEAHHWLSHHGGNQEKIAMLTKICTHHVSQFSQFLERMRATPDGDGALLDHSLLMYGAGFGDGNLHNAELLPVAVVGGACGALKGNRFIKYPEHTPLMNLGLSLLDKVGVEFESVGDSTGGLVGL